ncbi:MAG: hypothetical protein KGO93_06855 [Cyanobacteria bacterium REEB446]|nr:hypothetical protein [Cyanobacteria bacterium REEB446]
MKSSRYKHMSIVDGFKNFFGVKGHCCLIKITQRSQEEMMKKASSIEFAAD